MKITRPAGRSLFPAHAARMLLWPHLPPLAELVALALLLTAPLPANLTTALPGLHGDSYFHLWNYWWLHAALTQGLNPLFSPQVLHPTGCELTLHSLALTNTVPAALLAGWLPLIAVYNLVIIAGFIVAGWGMYALAWELTASRAGAFVAGCLFAFAPYHYQHLSRPDVCGYVWLPLTALFLLRIWRAPRLIDGLGFAAFFTLACYSAWYYFFSQLALAVVIGTALLFGARRRVLNRRALAALGGGLLLAGLLLAPAVLPMLAIKRRAAFGDTALAVHAAISADPLAFITPPPFQPLWGWLTAGWHDRLGSTEPVAYLGWLALALAGYGAGQMPRRTRWLWLLLLATGLVLALGPVLHWNGRWHWADASLKSVPLPYYLLYKLVPPLRGSRAPIRFIVLAYLALAVLAAFAARQLAARRPRLLVLLTGLLLLDYLAVPYPVVQPAVPALYREIAASDARAVLEVPVTDYPSVLQYYQTVHGKALVIGAVTHIPPWRFAFLGETPVVRELYNLSLLTPAREQELAGKGRAPLAAAGIGWVVVHPELIDNPAATGRIVNFLTGALAAPPEMRDNLLCWRLREAEE